MCCHLLKITQDCWNNGHILEVRQGTSCYNIYSHLLFLFLITIYNEVYNILMQYHIYVQLLDFTKLKCFKLWSIVMVECSVCHTPISQTNRVQCTGNPSHIYHYSCIDTYYDQPTYANNKRTCFHCQSEFHPPVYPPSKSRVTLIRL